MGVKASGRQSPRYPWKFTPPAPALPARRAQSSDHSALAKTGLVFGPPGASHEEVSFVSLITVSRCAASPAPTMICRAAFSLSRTSGESSSRAVGTDVPLHAPFAKLYVVG